MSRVVDTLQAGQERAYQIGGNYLNVIKSGQLLEIELVRHSNVFENHFLKQGAGIYKKDFNSIVVRNAGDEEASIVLVSGAGSYSPSQSDSTVRVDTSEGSVPVTLDEDQLALAVNQQLTGENLVGLAKVTIAAGAVGALAAANPLRKYLRINVLSSAETEFILIGGVDSNTGGALERGMVGCEEIRGAVSAFNPSAFPVDVYLLEVTD